MKIPYKLTMASSIEQRHAQMAQALQSGLPRIRQVAIDDTKSATLACYGPSLADTWEDMTRPIVSMSGSLRFLVERGVIPDYHIELDPRPHKVKFLEPPVDGVHYLMASVCHPRSWEVLKGQKVTLWHARSADETGRWVAENDPGQLMITCGSTVGISAIHVMGVLGYRHFEIHGMDGSIRDGARHAGPHYGHKQGGITWDVHYQRYDTSRIMSNACAEMVNMCRLYPIFIVFHGEGLQQALLDEQYDIPNVAIAGTSWADAVRKARAHIQPVEEPAYAA